MFDMSTTVPTNNLCTDDRSTADRRWQNRLQQPHRSRHRSANQFYAEDGVAVSGPVVQLQPAEIRFVEIASLIPAQERWRVRWGGMSLSYTGKAFDIWAQITLLGAINSGSSDVTFSV